MLKNGSGTLKVDFQDIVVTAGNIYYVLPSQIHSRVKSDHAEGWFIAVDPALIIFALGFAGLFFAGTKTPYWQLFLPFLLMPVGMGMAVPAMTSGILGSVDKALSGTASAVLNTIRQQPVLLMLRYLAHWQQVGRQRSCLPYPSLKELQL